MAASDDDPNPLLREVRVAVKKLQDINSLSSTVPSFNSNPTSSSSSTLHDKLHQLKVSALSLKQKQVADGKRLHELNEAREPLCNEIIECIMVAEEHRRRLNTQKPPAHEIDTIIAKQTRLKEMTMEIVELSKVLTNSRLASFNEILQDLSRITNEDYDEDDEEFGKIWNELKEGLMRAMRFEVTQFQVLAKKIGGEIATIEDEISNFFYVRDNCSCTNGQFCGGHGLVHSNRRYL